MHLTRGPPSSPIQRLKNFDDAKSDRLLEFGITGGHVKTDAAQAGDDRLARGRGAEA
jgi:hypothetical protein